MKQRTADIVYRIAQLVTGIALLYNTGAPVYERVTTGAWNADAAYVALMTASAFALVHVPRVIRRFDIMLMPAELQVALILFDVSAMFLGKVVGFYIFFPWWDLMLHFVSGVMFAICGYVMFVSMNRNAETRAVINPAFAVMFAVCFSLASSAVWEMFEFMMDSLAKINMQGWHNEYTAEQWLAMHNVSNASNPGLIDTMSDIVSGTAGALLSIPFIRVLARRQNRYVKEKHDPEELARGIWSNKDKN